MSPAAGSFQLTTVATGLVNPIFITDAGDGSGRLFIVEQAGVIRILKGGSVLSTPFLDIRAKVASGGERGLLSVAFVPDYKAKGEFIVDYTRSADHMGDSVIARYRVSAASDVADPLSEEVLMVIPQPQNNHNGGLVLFGPDKMLHIGSGDGGNGDDYGPGHAPEGNGQSLATWLGKILRIDVSGPGAYKVPPDNPDLGAGAKPEIWAYGLRNPWRFSFDRTTGDLFIGDVGQNAWEEVDHQPKSSQGGENYGWPVFEATERNREGVSISGDTKPVAQYANPTQGCAVTGGHVYRGAKIPALQGLYVFGDYCQGRLWTLSQSSGAWTMAALMDTDHRISSFGEDAAGELYLVDNGGSVLRFDPV